MFLVWRSLPVTLNFGGVNCTVFAASELAAMAPLTFTPESCSKKVQVEEGAAEFAVGDGSQPDCCLLLDGLSNMRIFDLAQFRFGQFAVEKLCPRRQ